MPSPPAPSHPESDPEGTAELPLLDPAAEAAAREERQSQTDTWVAPLPARLAEALAQAAPLAEAPPPAGAAPARQAQLTEQALSAKLHETQDLLASKSARLTQVERARDEVHAARAAAEQSAEGRRLMLEGLVTDLQRQAEDRERDVARVARELEGRDALARERDAELAQRAARLTQLEEQTSSSTTALAQRDTQLRETRHETQALQDSVATLRSQLAAATERLRTLQASVEQHGGSDSQQQTELTRP